jgi:Putative Flp pilus-assembly TadE/G-like
MMKFLSVEKSIFGYLSSRLVRLIGCCSGNIAVMTALTAPVLLAAAGAAIDYGVLSMKVTQLHELADSAAIGGAKELSLAGSSDQSIASTVQSYITQEGKTNVAYTLRIDRKAGSLNVALEETWTPFFAHFLDAGVTPIHVQATASLVGSSSICILALDDAAAKALHLDKSAKITAKNCGVYSNSTHSQGIRLDMDSSIKSSLICSAGGVKAKTASVSPPPTTDCPPVDDPLADRKPPPTGSCDYSGMKIVEGSKTLDPGTYCDGLEVSGTATVHFNPGTYIVQDGPFKISNNARVDGKHVGFYLAGQAAIIDFSGDSSISLSGATSGELSGLLFFEDRSASLDRKHRIGSANASELTGTIYLSRGSLWVDPNSSVAEDSAYTAIIAHKLELNEGPELVMNSNYGATDVPVPAGVRSSAQVVLIK